MKRHSSLLFLFVLIIVGSCSDEDIMRDSGKKTDLLAYGEHAGGSNNSGGQGEAGVITAGEWNDQDHWDFWQNLLEDSLYSSYPGYWRFYTNNRFAVQLLFNGDPVANAGVELYRNGNLIWSARTDNLGKAELWAGTFQYENLSSTDGFSLHTGNQEFSQGLMLAEQGVNVLEVGTENPSSSLAEIAFIVDATGSMGDELEFLKEDLKSVIDSIRLYNTGLSIRTGAVYYRDEGDEFITRRSDLSDQLSATLDFIGQQQAGGGGDFPEAVHKALKLGITELQWSVTARTRIAFLLLDAPPHYEKDIIESIQATVQQAALQGIKIIPITASGIDKETEFLMRFMAILTNGTYVFITDDSGVGTEHLTPTVGEYQYEKLNSLLIRLILKYSE